MTKEELIKPNKLSISVGQDLDLNLINKLLIDLDFEKWTLFMSLVSLR